MMMRRRRKGRRGSMAMNACSLKEFEKKISDPATQHNTSTTQTRKTNTRLKLPGKI